MGQIVGAAIVSHHPGLMQCEEFRVLMGNGRDSDLIADRKNYNWRPVERGWILKFMR